MTDGIDVGDCAHRHVYRIFARNLRVGVFVADRRGFVGIRQKGHPSNLYLDTEYHRDNGPPYGTACPLEDLGPLPDEIQAADDLGTVCHNCGVPAKYDKTKPRVAGDGASLPGTWIHLAPSECEDLRPVGTSNRALFEHLMAIELGLGFEFQSVEEYEAAMRAYEQELADLGREDGE